MLYQFPVIIVFYTLHFLVCLKSNLCVNCALYLSPYSLSYTAIHTIEMSLFVLISGSAFLLIAPTDGAQNSEIHLFSSKYWLESWENHELLTVYGKALECQQILLLVLLCVSAGLLLFYLHPDTQWKSQLKSAEELLAHLGRRKMLPLCSSTASIIMYHPGCPGRWLHTGLSIITGYIYPLRGVFVMLAVLLDVVQECFSMSTAHYCVAFLKTRGGGGFELYLLLGKYFIVCDYPADR